MKGIKKLLGVIKTKKDSFLHAPDEMVLATWFEVDGGSLIG